MMMKNIINNASKNNSPSILPFLFLFLFQILILQSSTHAQVTQEWVQNYNYTSGTDEYMTDMKMDDLGNIYICGWVEYAATNRDYLLLKYSNNGQLIWSNVHDRTWADRFNSIQLDSKGNIYAFGGTIGVEHVLIKYDSTGYLIWERNIDSSYQNAVISSRFKIDSSGNTYLTGTTNFINTGDMLTLKYDSTGYLLWEKLFMGLTNGHETGNDVKLKNHYIYVLGSAYVSSSTGRDVTIVKYDPSGTIIDTLYCDAGSSNDAGIQLEFDKEKNLVVSGTQTNPITFRDIFVAKLDTIGNKFWYRIYNNNHASNEEVFYRKIMLDKSNNIYLLCMDLYQPQPMPRRAYTLIKYNPVGDSLWTRKYIPVSNSSSEPFDFVVDKEGNSFITGFSDFIQPYTRISTVKYSSVGDKLWNIEFHPLFTNNEGKKILLDNESNMYVGGISTAFGNGWNIVLIKYNLLTGIVQNNQSEIKSFALYQNYPNPFNPETRIRFEISEREKIILKVFDILGRDVVTLINEEKAAGIYEITFNADNLTSGAYFYRLTAGNYSETKKMLLQK